MAPQHALVALLTLASTAFGQFTSETSSRGSAFWTGTVRYMVTSTTSTSVRYSTSTATYTLRTTRTALSSVTPKATPTSTTSSRYYTDLDLNYEYYAAGAFAESELEPPYVPIASRTSSATSSTSIIFSMPVTMTAPTSCPTSYTYSTTTSVSVPSQVWAQITPSSTQSVRTTTRYDGDVILYSTWYLSANAAPFTSSRNFDYSYYIASCKTVPTYRSTSTDSPRSGGGSTTSSSGDYCYGRYSYYCGSTLKTWIIIIAAVIPGLFLLGIFESYFWFRRLMNGKSAMRFGTVCWVLISLWVLCFTRMQDARSKEDQRVLAEKWKNMGSGAAFKAWMKWGFRHSYPVEHLGQYSKMTVGIVPAGQPVHPEMAQGPPPPFMPGAPPPAFQPGQPGQQGQVFYYGPPPPGWVPTPDGQGFMPPQGYNYPSPHTSGYYGAAAPKDQSTVSSSPVSALGPQQHFPQHQQPGQAPMQGQAPSPIPGPQPVYPAPGTNGAAPAPVGFGQVVQQHNAPQAPPSNVSEAPANPPRAAPSAPAPTPAPAASTSAPAPAAPHQPPKNDPNDRSLYE